MHEEVDDLWFTECLECEFTGQVEIVVDPVEMTWEWQCPTCKATYENDIDEEAY